jgi:uncharacterized protein involved in exopolysaccharide biosynthesis
MISTENAPAAHHNEVDVMVLWREVWRYKIIVVIVVALCAAIAVFLALTATPLYRAEIVVLPVRENAAGGMGALSGQLGGLASLAGMAIGSGGPGREGQAMLQSRLLVEEFVIRNKILDDFAKGSPQKITLWFAVQRFRKTVLSIDEDKVKGLTTVGISWTDPVVAARWANQFVALANELMRERALADADRNITYLNAEISRTHVVELQRIMYSLVESEMKTRMLASGREEYAFTVVDPGVAPEMRYSPRRTLWVLTGMALGFVLGAIAALLYGKASSMLRAKRMAAFPR